MTDYRIRPCRLADLRALGVVMRKEDRSELIGAGFVPRHALVECWRSSLDPIAAEVDVGEGWQIAAVAGDMGPVLSPVGAVWLFTAPAIERFPLAFLRETRHWLHGRLRIRERLESSIRADYHQAVRFFALAGFHIREAERVPPNGVLYHPIEMGRG